MTQRRKRVFAALGALLAVLVVAGFGFWWMAFGGRRPIVNGAGPRPGIETVAMGFVSAFMLDAGPGAIALVDTGTDNGGEAIVRALRARGLGPDAVHAIFVTHGHGDHIGSIHRFPSAEVYVLAAERDLVARAGVRVSHVLGDGETVTLGSLVVRAFALPGHTAGSAAYLADDTLFLGDGASAASDGHVRGPVWLFSKSTRQGIASLHALAQRLVADHATVRALAFAHSGPIVDDPLGRLAAAE